MKLVRRGPSPWMPQSYVRWIDKDQDGIPDKLEEKLLRRFRPYYKFSQFKSMDIDTGIPIIISENYRPCDAIWQIRYADLRDGDWTDYEPDPDIIETCGASPYYLLDPPSQLLTCVCDETNLMKPHKPQNFLEGLEHMVNKDKVFFGKTNYFLNIDDDKRSGPSWEEAIANAPGLYGHVVPERDTERDSKLYKIEYWQYFGYSGMDVPGGDHEGDWCTVQLWYDPTAKKLVKTSHYAHGYEMTFDLTKAGQPFNLVIDNTNMVEYRGSNYDTSEWDLRSSKKKVPISPFFSISGHPITNPTPTVDNAVRFYIDGEGNEHVVVYIERDSHEFWPTEYGEVPLVNEHNGKGPSYLTAYNPERPLNLGEVENPLSADAKIILQYSGYWGCYHHIKNFPPPGPPLHQEWTWPAASELRPKILPRDFEG